MFGGGRVRAYENASGNRSVMCTARLHCKTDEFASCHFFAFTYLFICFFFFWSCQRFFVGLSLPSFFYFLFLFLYVLLTVLGPFLYIIVCLSLFPRFVFVCKHVFFWSCALRNRMRNAMQTVVAVNPLTPQELACV